MGEWLELSLATQHNDAYPRSVTEDCSQLSSPYSCRNGLFSSPETKFSAQYTLHNQPGTKFEEKNGTIILTSGPCQNSGQSRERTKAWGQYWSCNGDFSAQFNVGPRISDISGGRKLLSNDMAVGNTQCHVAVQPLFMCESMQKPCSSANVAKPTRPKTGVWFILQVAPTKDGERLLPQIPKTYLRIKLVFINPNLMKGNSTYF
ncbi:hypothetical protein KI387_001445 [Taxus chinensis]|uniref:Uncharacterized protein n=1 Tax=Taxus chinensis TaxID=29808 RepID=A0AA38GV34_TAXCH|nr:hypothetical protein KI387_001445 [Taxus chinensis]